jgi:ABC-type lipoprotein export system ATPase subunit
MLRPTAGRVCVAGHEIHALSAPQRAQFRADHIGFVFQMFHLVPYLTILENVVAAAHRGTTAENRSRAQELLAQLGLEARQHHVPADLSAGERQRAALARALLNQPKLILADEPTGNLDPANAAEVFRHLKDFQRGGGTVIVVTHGATGEAVADRVVEMAAGRMVVAGDSASRG